MIDAAFLRRPIAHRALHGPGAPENSRAAVRAAVAAGYGVELDVQPSADGVAMVFHDEDLLRLTGEAGRIAGRSAAELGALTLAQRAQVAADPVVPGDQAGDPLVDELPGRRVAAPADRQLDGLVGDRAAGRLR